MKHLGWRSYFIQFAGSVSLDRPLQPAQAAYLQRFLLTRRVAWRVEQVEKLADPLREAVGLPLGPEGAYFVDLSFDELPVATWRPLVLNQNQPPQGQPFLWCFWKLEEDGLRLRYADQRYELYYCYAWLEYLIEHFFSPWGYTLNGEITWQGDDAEDRGTITVKNKQLEHQLLQASGESRPVWPDQPIACVHKDALETKLLCTHLANQEMYRGWRQWFTGQGREFYLVCNQCADMFKQEGRVPVLCQMCWRCYNEVADSGAVGAPIGRPEVFVRSTSLSMVHGRKDLALPERLLDIQPVNTRQESVWIALTHEGELIEINLTAGTFTHLLSLPDSKLDRNEAVTVQIAPGGQYLAVVNTHGRHGLVLELATGHITMQLERDTYHTKHCHFPLAFFEDEHRMLLIYGTHWNRLDITDPRTGESLTQLSFVVPPGRKYPAHYHDYFHGRLSVSPDQQWVVDDGWIWHPKGSVVTWNIRRWLHENLWESDDGPSLLGLCTRDGYWDGPLCWIDERMVAIWGYGEDADWLIPAVRIFDVIAEKELDWFAGPEGTLVYDEYLFALSEHHGLTAWDVATGERVLAEPDFRPTRYHRGAKQFLHIDLQDGKIQAGTLGSRS
jgi:hypothetical protein